MPNNERKPSNLFLKTENGEMIPCGDIEEFMVGMEIKSQWQLVKIRKLICNNWRKMHRLPLIRRREKRK